MKRTLVNTRTEKSNVMGMVWYNVYHLYRLEEGNTSMLVENFHHSYAKGNKILRVGGHF